MPRGYGVQPTTPSPTSSRHICVSASAIYSPITNTGEPGHAAILAGIYGGTVTASGARDFTVDLGGGVSFDVTRIADDFTGGGSTLQLGSPDLTTMSDQVWQDGVVDIVGQARYAGFSQAFGTGDTTADGSVAGSWLFDVSGNGTSVSGGGQLTLGSGEFSWVRADQTGGDALGTNRQSSLEGDNLDGSGSPVDEMVSYLIDDPDVNGGRPTYLLFFEDGGAGPDRDFNDLVIEVSVVPVPAALGLGLLGLAGAGIARRRLTA